MGAVWVLIGAGFRDGMEVGRSLVLFGCPPDGPEEYRSAGAKELMSAALRADGLTGDLQFDWLRDRAMEAAMAAGEGNV